MICDNSTLLPNEEDLSSPSQPQSCDRSVKSKVLMTDSSLPIKKRQQLAVRWNDQDELHRSPASVAFKAERNEVSAKCTVQLEDSMKASNSSSNTPDTSGQLLQQLQLQIKKNQYKIRRACELELHYIKKSRRIYEKRIELIAEMEEIRKKIRKLSPDAAEKDEFVLPPVLREDTASTLLDEQNTKPCVIDKTRDEDQSSLYFPL
jgi:hypothetical protein